MERIKGFLKEQINQSALKINEKFINNNKITTDDMVKILFNILDKELENFTLNSVHNIHSIIEYLIYFLKECDDASKSYITYKLKKIYAKIDCILIEKKNSLSDYEKSSNELVSVQEKIEFYYDEHYNFINFLIEEIKNLEYIEIAISKVPSLVNTKDEDGKPIINSFLMRYFDNVLEEDEYNKLYYENIISLVLTQNELHLKFNEKEQLIKDIYSFIFKISVSKKNIKKYKNEINWLKNLITYLKTSKEEKIDINTLANKYKIKIDFEDYLIDSIKVAKVPENGENDASRVYVDDYLITIDKNSTVEIDDALSCRKLENGNYLLGVHIASVLSYFEYDSAIVDEAISRVHTIYLKNRYRREKDNYNKIIPIFPYEFSSKVASLLPNEAKYARSYYFEIDREGNVVNEKYFNTIVKSKKKTSYNEVNEILENGCKDEKLLEVISNLNEVVEVLESKYKPTILYEKIKENINDYSDLRVKREGAEKIVYYATLLTGNRVAEYFADKKYPFLYRVHEISQENNDKLQMLINNLSNDPDNRKYKKLADLLETVYPKGYYAMSGEHKGLKLSHYCHCTSEIRRGSDIIAELALKICYDKNPTDKQLYYLENEIKRREIEINSKSQPIEWFAREFGRSYQKKKK
ncbi:MAG: RNB domain-containing ribonuclease [Bacilli bacterium]|nr:RNB domain-containing ribonuclease [Bacilli bacterium]